MEEFHVQGKMRMVQVILCLKSPSRLLTMYGRVDDTLSRRRMGRQIQQTLDVPVCPTYRRDTFFHGFEDEAATAYGGDANSGVSVGEMG